MSDMLIHPDEALKRILQSKVNLASEVILAVESLGRVIGLDIASPIDFPMFDNSAMDGYVCKTKDPAYKLKVIETIPAGVNPAQSINYGECARIMTGAKIPNGADQVVKFEDVIEQSDGWIQIINQDHNHNIRYRGENLKKGELLLRAGKIIRAQEIAALAAVGINSIQVFRQPLAGILITGSEFFDPEESSMEDKVFNSNGPQLCNQIKAISNHYKYYGIIKDCKDSLLDAVEAACSECRLVLISGGVSAGDFDFVPEILIKLGVELKFQQVAMKPGKPLLFGVKGDTLVFGLPGNPVSSFITFEIFVKPLIYKMMGHNFSPPMCSGILAESIVRNTITRTEFMPVYFDGINVSQLPFYGSSHINILCNANALLKINPGVSKIAEGERVNVRPI